MCCVWPSGACLVEDPSCQGIPATQTPPLAKSSAAFTNFSSRSLRKTPQAPEASNRQTAKEAVPASL
eukprot:CAMPEP_0181230704 /NCGR_PEP_ID=MMETSP1096-20121128/34639_1 /TAXON_ID=156174 ORGANISM="Chrysochromulina ericina, Strain CCMP281" /NCGR_SAMPLE_ID=MMETSP1096 /ASSEMBLY_ACC=CAM_ASM_000453 /LENGTH=66 /DNA_ID=CAMNT_0023324545 /DNA_START=74 /DNA_END=271 /DNA_ORIENTATION=-